ncbi:dienelactone hydrolase family protein [Agromyces sp. SYSU T00194]|uniref:dienelactone hydrolase family protein n=1 Tax=Agromyces chitinivorans TaxID=3158560 RepID=UPI0033908F57
MNGPARRGGIGLAALAAYLDGRPTRAGGPDGLADVLGVPAHDPPAPRDTGAWRTDGLHGGSIDWSAGYGPRTEGWWVAPEGGGPFPTVVLLHCHGGVTHVGGQPMIAVPGDDARVRAARERLYAGLAVGNAFARAGVAAVAFDTFGWGSRRVGLHPGSSTAPLLAALEATDAAGGMQLDQAALADREASVLEPSLARAASLLGTSFAGLAAHDDLVALDVVRGLPMVDADRVSLFGYSGGGARASFLAALDGGFASIVVACMMSTWRAMVPDHVEAHSWLVNSPGLPRHAELHELLATPAGPRRLVQYGRRDELFPPAGMAAAHAALEASGIDYRGSFHDSGHEFTAAILDEAVAFVADGEARR